MDVHLAFVVGGAAAVDVAVADFGLKSGRGPEIKWLSGLHVIVAVEKNGGLAGRFEGFGVNERMELGGNNFDGFESREAQVIGDPSGAAFDVGLVLAFGADGRDAEKFAKFFEVLLTAAFYEFRKSHQGPSGARI